MTLLTVGTPVTTTEPTLVVENKLVAGAHEFQLVVVADDGVASDPVTAVVQIVNPPAPPPPPAPPRNPPIRPVTPAPPSGGRPS
jgi:hypothetical protein